MEEVEYKMFSSQIDYKNYCFNVWNYKKKEVKKVILDELYKMNAQELLELCNQEDSVPVNIKTILKTIGISAIPYDFSIVEKRLSAEYKNKKILGALVTNEKGSVILYSDKDKHDSHRVRFTIAHEIAHCCLHNEKNHVEFRIDGDRDSKEIAANTFAGELLVPEKALKNVINQLILPTITALADIFDVSINVMRERLRYLNLSNKILGA